MSRFPLDHRLFLNSLLFLLHVSISSRVILSLQAPTKCTHVCICFLPHISHTQSDLLKYPKLSPGLLLLPPLSAYAFRTFPLAFIIQTAPSGNYEGAWNAPHMHTHRHRCAHTCMFGSCPLLQELATLIPVGHKHYEMNKAECKLACMAGKAL